MSSRNLATEFVTDRTGMAYVLGCSVNHVNKLVSRGLPRQSRGQYSVPEAVQWFISDLTSRGHVDPDEMPAVVKARTDLYVAQEAHKRLETRRMAGELVDVGEVQTALLKLAQVLIAGLEGLPMRAAQEMAGVATTPEAAAVLRGHCNAIRNQIADELAALAAPLESGAQDRDAAARSDSVRVGRRGAANGTGRVSAPGPVAD